MDLAVGNEVLLFEGFRFDRRGGGLSRQEPTGRWVPVSLGGRAIDVLAALLVQPGDLTSKDAIMQSVWPGLAVEEKNLTVQISTLRRVLDAGRGSESCIQTVPGRGYRFVGRVTRAEPAIASEMASRSMPAAALSATWRPPWRGLAAGVGVVALVAGGVAAWLRQASPQPPIPPASATAPLQPRPAAYTPQDRRQSVIVLPFENSSDDPAHDGVAASFTRDLTDRIAETPEYPLVPAATAAAYRGKPLDLLAVGRTHDVHFALTGNARREHGRLIITATLFDVAAQRSLWSQRYDRPDTTFSWGAILWGIRWNFGIVTTDAEAERARRERPESLDQRDLVLIALSTPYAQISKQTKMAQLELIGRALALDPGDFRTIRVEASNRMGLAMEGFSENRAGDLARARQFVDRVLLLKPNDTRALRTKAFVLRTERDYAKAEALMRRVVELDPMAGYRYRDLAWTLMDQGKHQDALDNFLAAKRIYLATGLGAFAVHDTLLPRIDAGLAAGFLANGRYPEAVEHARLAIAGFPDSGLDGTWVWLTLIAAESLNGEIAAARADLQIYLAQPQAVQSVAQLLKRRTFPFRTILVEGLRHAGMPDE